MFDNSNDIGSQTESVCELFSCDRDSKVFEYLAQHSESPLQVPFYYLDLIRMGKEGRGAARSAKPTAEQVELGYRAILQRPPEDGAVVRQQIERCNDIEQLLVGLLSSQEAILRMPQLHARAFPLTRRLWHVHIPKTAGTSFFSTAVESGWGYVNTNILADAIGNLQQVAAAVRLSPGTKGRTIISGHWHLWQSIDGIGPFDHVVAFVRDPVELCISEFNYAVDAVIGRPNVHSVDPKPFLARGLDKTSFLKTLENGFFAWNAQCSYLSADATCGSALKNLATCQAELLPCDAVDSAASRFFPAVAQPRENVSNKHVRSVDLDGLLREEIIVRNNHDFLLYEIAKMRCHELRS